MRNRFDLKNIVAVLVIIASFVIAVGLAVISNNRETYWVAARELSPGHLIESQDFHEGKAAFGKNVSGYLRSNQSPIGFAIAKRLSSGEFLHQSALQDPALLENLKLFSFAVAAPDLPDAINVGDLVNLYQVINDNGDGSLVPSQLIIESVYVVAVNRKNQNIGGSAIVTVSIPNEFIERALNATRKGRIVVIANHG